MGLGKTGISVARSLKSGGAEVWAWDDAESQRKGAEAAGVKIVNLYECNWQKPAALVLSPGIPDRNPQPHEIASKAREHGCEIICDIDLLARSIQNSFLIGITGTNGKSTTTALLGHILAAAGRRAEIGGNYGIPVLELEPLGSDGIYVLELSSYQLERIPSVSLNISILLNISPDHLERHGGMGGYISSKVSILEQTNSDGFVVVGMDDSHCRGIVLEMMAQSKNSSQKMIPISGKSRVPGGVYIEGSTLIDDTDYHPQPLIDLANIKALPGCHNWQNIAAAFSVARVVGITTPVILEAIINFPGLPHRQELVRKIGKVRYINDSKATNCEAAANALACYESIHWIAGGQLKRERVDILHAQLASVKHLYLIGESTSRLSAIFAGKVKTTTAKNLNMAVQQAHNNAQSDGQPAVVLLSPACASFDQFKNFEERGKCFKIAVEQLT